MKKWFVFLIFVGCKVSSFTTQVEPGTEFNKYQTFVCTPRSSEVNITQPEYDNPENRKLINEAIKTELSTWGITPTKEDADILVDYILSIKDMTDTRVDSAIVYKPWVDLKQDTFSYTEGSLTLILIDNKTGKVIAQAKLEGVMDRDPKRFKSTIPRVIKRMFNRFETESQ